MIDWVDLFSVQGTLKSLFQHQVQKHQLFNAKPILWSIHETGKIIALTIWTFINKVMSLLFNMLPRLVMAFLPKIKSLLIS